MWEEANQTKKTSGYSCLLNPSLLKQQSLKEKSSIVITPPPQSQGSKILPREKGRP